MVVGPGAELPSSNFCRFVGDCGEGSLSASAVIGASVGSATRFLRTHQVESYSKT